MTQETIVLGGGCFWCTEALFQRVPGVLQVRPGYAGGHTPSPAYDDVSSGRTGHAEVISVTFDPARVRLPDLLALFFALHDPTTRDRQGADEGSQYRSIILWTSKPQEKIIEEAMRNARREFAAPIVTEVTPLRTFYPAELDHQQYYEKNPGAPYCQVVIAPKLEKLQALLAKKE